MDITLQYFDGCPSWEITAGHLETLHSEGIGFTVTRELIETQAAAEAASFHGSPTVLIDGADPFADADAPVGLSCRVYFTDAGVVGSPSLDQLREALGRSR